MHIPLTQDLALCINIFDSYIQIKKEGGEYIVCDHQVMIFHLQIFDWSKYDAGCSEIEIFGVYTYASHISISIYTYI